MSFEIAAALSRLPLTATPLLLRAAINSAPPALMLFIAFR
jgi:hypothetical protein